MDKKQISLTDWHRMLMGDLPWLFLAELLIRTVVVYFMLLVLMRLMGKRVASQLSISELAVILTLGAAIGLPLQVPDKWILPAFLVLLLALLFQRGLSLWAFKRRKVETLSQGDVSIMLKDGRLLPDTLKRSLLSPEKSSPLCVL